MMPFAAIAWQLLGSSQRLAEQPVLMVTEIT